MLHTYQNKSRNEESISHYCCQGLFLREHFQHAYHDCAQAFPLN
jgi:hypothetical protein